MRPDMCKVIVERPRYGSRLKKRKKHWKKGYRKYVSHEFARENLPRREPMLGAWRGKDKSLNEHLGPLKKFLRSQVGRPWDLVHRDLCEHISFANAVQSHVLDHLHCFVAQPVEVHGSRVIGTVSAGLRGRTLQKGDMYVCPKTGLLKVAKDPRQNFLPTAIRAEPRLWYVRDADGWWEVRLQVWDRRLRDPATGEWFTQRRRPEPFDVWCGCLVTDRMKSEFPYAAEEYAISKRGLRPGEVSAILKRYGSRKRLERDLHNWSGYGRQVGASNVVAVQAGDQTIAMSDHGRPIGY
jgi:hypothetical protein